MMHFDAIIIGTGQAGPSLDAGFSAAGKTVAIIERYCCHLSPEKATASFDGERETKN
jgi:pyruvate/2-oxoglutarate dehydrogenase complex dihydrolipoamide dehydrogenase (E3) component